MAKVQIAVRLDQELLDAMDRIAERTGETRTDVLTAALERGLYEEEKFLASESLPVVRDVVGVLLKSGLAGQVAKLLGHEIDPRKMRIAERERAKRRGGKVRGSVKGAGS